MLIKFIYIFALFIVISECAVKTDWIDPHDMNTHSNRKLKKATGKTIVETRSGLNIPDENYTLSKIFLKRVVSLLLKQTHFDEPLESHIGEIGISFSTEDYKYLKLFVENEKTSDEDLRNLDTILTHGLTKSESNLPVFGSLAERLSFLVYNENFQTFIFLIAISYFVYRCFTNEFSIVLLMKYMIFFAWIFDFIQRYKQLMKENDLKYLKNLSKSQCSTLQNIFGYITGLDYCEDEIERNISVFEVFHQQLFFIISSPLTHLGSGLGKFASNLQSSLPFWTAIYLFPLMLIFSLFIFILFFSWVTGRSLKLNVLWHLFNITFCENEPTQPSVKNARNKNNYKNIRPKIVKNSAVEDVNLINVGKITHKKERKYLENNVPEKKEIKLEPVVRKEPKPKKISEPEKVPKPELQDRVLSPESKIVPSAESITMIEGAK